MTLTDFLLARIAEDEADQGNPSVWENTQWHSADCETNSYNAGGCDCGIPARVLADCQAKRAIVDMHKPDLTHRDAWAHDVDPSCTWYGDGDHDVVRSDECPTLRHLATVYADHPDHHEEWAS